jgi:peptide deformylase
MSVLPIVRLPDPVLKKPTRLIERVDAPALKLIDGLMAAMRHHPRCVGIAAPQVGSPLRIAVMDASIHPKTTSSHGPLVLVNPRILAAEGAVVNREGCLSVPDFTGNVRRATRIHLAAHNRDGEEFRVWMEGFEAVIAQHEVDHLDGLLFLDRIENVSTDVFRRKSYG